MIDPVDSVIVNCAFDIGHRPHTLVGSDMYPRMRTLVARLLAAHGDTEDVLHPGLSELDLDIIQIFSEYMTVTNRFHQLS